MLLKYKHTSRELITDKPDININVYFVKWSEPGPYVTADLGFSSGDLGNGMTPRAHMVRAYLCVCVCVCVRARACVCVCVCV